MKRFFVDFNRIEFGNTVPIIFTDEDNIKQEAVVIGEEVILYDAEIELIGNIQRSYDGFLVGLLKD